MAASHRAAPRFERHGSTPRASVASGGAQPARSKAGPPRRSNAARPPLDDGEDLGRVRVAVRLRPKSAEDIADNMNSAYCIELQPEMKRLKLKRNNWSSESYRFDEVLTENASQKRVYEVVANPVVESVLNGYNGTIMAYGQTGTGKTYTLGKLGRKDPSERGIMVRAMEDMLANVSPGCDTVSISYLQLYLEAIQDLLNPEKNNIMMAEDPKTGEVSLPAASTIVIRDLNQFLQLLQIGEANRHAANTKLNTESSRSHAILMIHIQKSKKEADGDVVVSAIDGSHGHAIAPIMLKSKLLIVDLAGSERINKSGCEGQMLEETKFINLSLSSLGKCINALAENSPHIPIRESKLTRLLRDSFGGSARTSLILTIGQSVNYYAETASTIMFGQRAMKVVNVLKLKEEVDYGSLCRKLESQVDDLSREIEKINKFRNDEKELMEKKFKEREISFEQTSKSLLQKFESSKEENLRLQLQNRSLAETLETQQTQCNLMGEEIVRLRETLDQSKHFELESSRYQDMLADAKLMYEKKIAELMKDVEDGRSTLESLKFQLSRAQHLHDNEKISQAQEIIKGLKQELYEFKERHLNEISSLKDDRDKLYAEKISLLTELKYAQEELSQEILQRKMLEEESLKYKKLSSDCGLDLEAKLSSVGVPRNFSSSSRPRDSSVSQKDIFSKIIDEVGLKKVLDLLKSGDLDLQTQVVKVVANLAAEDDNQERIVEEGGLDSLLALLATSQDKTVLRLASAAIANLAMNSTNQGLIISTGGGKLLASLTSKTQDPQTLRMAAGAIANLCGNEKLHASMKKDGLTKALLEMSKSGHMEITAQIARGIANFAKCETRERNRGRRKGRSPLLDDGVLPWIISNSSRTYGSTRRHIDLALCHLAQNGHNTPEIISSGAVWELTRISQESSEDDICELARKTVKSNPSLMACIS